MPTPHGGAHCTAERPYIPDVWPTAEFSHAEHVCDLDSSSKLVLGRPTRVSPALCRCAAHQVLMARWRRHVGCCPNTMHIIPRCLGTRRASCLITQHAAAEGIVYGRVTLLASQAQGSMTSLSCGCR